MRFSRNRARAAITACMLGCLGVVPSASLSAAETNAEPAASAGNVPGTVFLTQKTRLWLDRSQVLCFKAAGLDKDHVFAFQADPKFVDVLMPPTILPGETIGYLRLRARMKGETRLTLDGAAIEVDIVGDPAATIPRQMRPQIVSPARGAVVWGPFVVGVEELNLYSGAGAAPPVLRLQGGVKLPHRRCRAKTRTRIGVSYSRWTRSRSHQARIGWLR